MTAAQKTELEQEDWPGEGIWARSTQAEGKDDNMRLSEQIVQLWVAVQKPQKTVISNSQQLGSERDGNGNQHNTRCQGKNQGNCGMLPQGNQMFLKWGMGKLSSCDPKHPFNGNWLEVVGASTLPPRNATKWRWVRDADKYWQTCDRIWVSQPWSLGMHNRTCKWD